ncbi:glycoside hydrolase [Venturia nashicola]|uniref:Glycoside hydrolase n=1 Tax=Venturia nashicola TaxID=86259 RepID=A0A4Z1PMZ2_9PEZI|nr:glycoside hydrolase [Venturia nashicola]TLD39308.1 glycoside hydrolase [Venturia nashicola]
MTSNNAAFKEPKWWKESVIYQIYPASFRDLNGDGWGDVKGITSKVDYLKHLGVDIVWTSPIYKSPQADMGYDIADYNDIDEKYGTLADVDELIAELGKRGMKLMMDLVVNHTSEEHAWFRESRSSKTSSKRDWYIWRPAKYSADGSRHPPNNWSMILGEMNSAWTWDPITEEYYLSLFTPEQPDLNWENPAVREAVHDVLRFWLDRGVCGFRMDVINLISKVPGFPDGAIVASDHLYQPGFKHFANGPRLHEYLRELNEKVLSKYDTITVGEMPFVRDENEVLNVVHPDRNELNMIFIFEIVDLDGIPGSYRLTQYNWKKSQIREIMSKWQKKMAARGGWNSLFIENHDNPRSVSRYVSDSDASRDVGAKLLSLMMTTLGGTLYVYQGQELGVRNFPLEWDVKEYKDIESINYYKKMVSMYPQDKEKQALAKRILQEKARDHSRTPMPWTPERPNAGFSEKGVSPWMHVNDDFEKYNAQSEAEERAGDELSVLQFWRRGLKNRKEHKAAFVYGDFEVLGPETEENPIFAYKRSGGGETWVVILNFSEEERKIQLEGVKVQKWVTGTYDGQLDKPLNGEILLKPWEGLLGIC